MRLLLYHYCPLVRAISVSLLPAVVLVVRCVCSYLHIIFPSTAQCFDSDQISVAALNIVSYLPLSLDAKLLNFRFLSVIKTCIKGLSSDCLANNGV